MESSIYVNYRSTSNVYDANQFLREIAQYPVIAWDFEVAVKYTKKEIESMQKELAEIEQRLQEDNY